MRKEARARNDPSFTTAHLSSVSSKKERLPGNYNTRPSVTVHETDMSTDVTTAVKNATEDIRRKCHHNVQCTSQTTPTEKMQRFPNYAIGRRKKFIKGNNICYRCLASTSHQAKDCHVTIKDGNVTVKGIWQLSILAHQHRHQSPSLHLKSMAGRV